MMPTTMLIHALKTAGKLIIFSVIGTALLAYIYTITLDPIAKSEAEARLSLFREIISDDMHDNDLLKDVIKVGPNALLGNKEPIEINRVRLNNQPAGLILEAIAPDGYSGNIKLLVAIRADGSLSGVRVLAHKETPGLGDYIDAARGNWIKSFDNESLEKTASGLWLVKKDGGQFDYMAGATITPRAVIKAVYKALQYFKINKEQLLAETVNQA